MGDNQVKDVLRKERDARGVGERSGWNKFEVWIWFVVAGLIALYILAVLTGLLQLIAQGDPKVERAFAYIGLIAIPLVLYRAWDADRESSNIEDRAFDKAELESLFGECRVTIALAESQGKDTTASLDQLRKLEQKQGLILELEAVPLRLALVDLYDPSTLAVRIRGELRNLEDYSEDDYTRGTYQKWEKRVEDCYDDDDCTTELYDENGDANPRRLEAACADLRDLISLVAYLEYEWSKGSAMQRLVIYGAAVTALSMLLAGLLPVIAFGVRAELTALHWSAFGICGAMLATILSEHDSDAAEIGATQGKLLHKRAFIRVAIGAITPVLLLGALRSGVLAGTMFPDFVNPPDVKSLYSSVFWAIMSGFLFSSILNRLHAAAEQALGKSPGGIA